MPMFSHVTFFLTWLYRKGGYPYLVSSREKLWLELYFLFLARRAHTLLAFSHSLSLSMASLSDFRSLSGGLWQSLTGFSDGL